AKRAGIQTVILPKRNEKHLLEEVPEAARKALSIRPVDSIEEVMDLAFAEPVQSGRVPPALAGTHS
ncbi:MAG: S16 family serine protease, partial [Candidatus Methylomirabilia bacterium]